MKLQFIGKEMQENNKHMKESSTSLIIRKIKIVRYHFIYSSKDQKVWQHFVARVGETGLLIY